MAIDRLVRLFPDKPGKGGSKFSVPSIYPVLDTNGNYNAMIYAGKWQNFPGDTTSSGLVGQTGILATKKLHAYYRYSTTSGNSSPDYLVLGHNYTNGSADVIWDFVHGLAMNIYIGGTGINHTLLDSSGKAVPAKFVNVKNRCFIAWGVYASPLPSFFTTNFIWDGNAAGTAIPMGVPAPSQPILYTLTTGYSGTIWATATSQYLTYNWDPSQSGTWPNADGSYVLTAGGDTYAGAVVAYAGGGPPPVATDAVGGTWTYETTQQYIKVTGAVLDTKKYLGCTAYNSANGNLGIIAQVTIDANGADSHIVLTKVSATAIGTTPWKITKPMFTIASGKVWGQISGSASTQAIPFQMAAVNSLTWGSVAPRYAIARYNPTTGHISNVGPVLSVTELNQTVNSINLSIPVDGTNNDYYKAGYTFMLLFRSYVGVSSNQVLLPMGDFTLGSPACVGLILNFPVATPTAPGYRAFTDTYDNSTLLQGFVAPLTTNRQPPVYTQMALWDGKVWGVPVNNQQTLQFSADPSQVGFGVIEECAPSENILFIPAEDGRVIGMKTIGALLVLTTTKSSYYITGQGTSYRLVRLGSSMAGVGNEQFCEWTGESGDESARIVFIGTDGKVYRFTPFAGTEVISYPVTLGIETFFGTNYDYKTARIQQIVTKGFRLIGIRPPTQTYGGYATLYAFDYENQTWHSIVTNNGSADCFGVLNVDGVPPVQFFGFHGSCYTWCNWDVGLGVSSASPVNFIRTFPFDGGNLDDFKQFVMARIFVSDTTVQWTGRLVVDDETSYTLTFNVYPDKVRDPFPAPYYLLLGGFGSSGASQGNLVSYAPASQDGPIVGHRFVLYVNWPYPSSSYPGIYALYGVDLDLAPMEVAEAQGGLAAGN